MRMQRAIAAAVVFFVLISPFAVIWAEEIDGLATDSPPLGVIDPQLAAVGYSGREKLVYDVSWTGGIKIGELHLDVKKLPEITDAYEIRAFVTTKNGAVDIFYPVEDLHVTRVERTQKSCPIIMRCGRKRVLSTELTG